MDRIRVVDSHTEGEPTRVITEGGPDLGIGPLDQRRERFRHQFDAYRSAVVNEPRGSDVLVGALLCPPHDRGCEAGVIFFNNVGYLGMCGHGMIGVIATLRHLGQLHVGIVRVDTPAGIVTSNIGEDDSISIENVASHRAAKDVQLSISSIGDVVGDVAWGGNWFFLVREPVFDFQSTDRNKLLRIASAIRSEINRSGYPEVDHVELFGAPISGDSDSRNFVLCPGHQFDRSPCGTGTSAKLACLAADGQLRPSRTWVQEGILGTKFLASYRWLDDSKRAILPTIVGRAHVVAESSLLLDPRDPFCWGIPSTDSPSHNPD